MKIVSIINYKGGVGKTMLTANLGAELAWRGKKVLLIDLDAQASLTFSFITPDDWSKNHESNGTIRAWFESFEAGKPIALTSLIQKPKSVASRLSKGSLDTIYSHLGLINVDLELATSLGGSSLTQNKKRFINVHTRLSDGLEILASETDYDVVLIDCPPNFNIVTKTAIVASDYILVPTRPDELSTLGIDYLIRSVNGLIKEYNEYAGLGQGPKVKEITTKVLGVVFTMIQEYGSQPIAAQRAYIEKVNNFGSLTVFKSYIKRNDSLFSGAPAYGVPVVLLGYTNPTHLSVRSSLEAVTTEFSTILKV